MKAVSCADSSQKTIPFTVVALTGNSSSLSYNEANITAETRKFYDLHEDELYRIIVLTKKSKSSAKSLQGNGGQKNLAEFPQKPTSSADEVPEKLQYHGFLGEIHDNSPNLVDSMNKVDKDRPPDTAFSFFDNKDVPASSLPEETASPRAIVVRFRTQDQHFAFGFMKLSTPLLASLGLEIGDIRKFMVQRINFVPVATRLHLDIHVIRKESKMNFAPIDDKVEKFWYDGIEDVYSLKDKAISNRILTFVPSSSWWERAALHRIDKYLLRSLDNLIVSAGNIVEVGVHGVPLYPRVTEIEVQEEADKAAEYGKISKQTEISYTIFEGNQPVFGEVQRGFRAKAPHTVKGGQTDDIPKKIGFNRIGGMKRVLQELSLLILLPLQEAAAFDDFNVEFPKGVLLYGPAGVGKSLLANCLAAEVYDTLSRLKKRNEENGEFSYIDFTRCKISVHTANKLLLKSWQKLPVEIVIGEMFESERDASIRVAFGAKKAIHLIIIDDLHLLCPPRDTCNSTQVKALVSLLHHLDDVPNNTRRVFVGLSPSAEDIDISLRRFGRLEYELMVDSPTSEDRFEILKLMLSRTSHSLNDSQLKEVALLSQSFVGADLRRLIHAALLEAGRSSLTASLHHWEAQKSMSASDHTEDLERLNGSSSSLAFEHLKAALSTVTPISIKEHTVQIPTVRWDDIGGYASVKERLQECVEWPYKYREAFRSLRMTPPTGILLYGPPGCSKTLMAKAVATESRMNFLSVKGPELFNMWVGESERAVREVFRKAQQSHPCVIFFDEIDSIGATRDNESSSNIQALVLSQLLNEMDGITPLREIVVIGATNRPDTLDPALTRPGRLDRLIYVPLPDEIARREIFRTQLLNLPVSLSWKNISLEDTPLHQSIDVSKSSSSSEIPKEIVLVVKTRISIYLAGITAGYSGAEIVLVCREAAMLALKEKLMIESLLFPATEGRDFDKNAIKSDEEGGKQRSALEAGKGRNLNWKTDVFPCEREEGKGGAGPTEAKGERRECGGVRNDIACVSSGPNRSEDAILYDKTSIKGGQVGLNLAGEGGVDGGDGSGGGASEASSKSESIGNIIITESHFLRAIKETVRPRTTSESVQYFENFSKGIIL